MDWKFGQLPVTEAQYNIQLIAYALGVFQRFPSVERIEAGIVAPRVSNGTSYATFLRKDYDSWIDVIVKVIEEANNPFKRPAGGIHCTYCTNKPNCPVMNEAARSTADEIGLLHIPSSNGIVDLRTPEDRAKAMLLAKLLPDWCDMVRRHCAMLCLEHGEETPGFTLRRRVGSVSVKDLPKVLEFAEKSGVDRDAVLYQASNVSFSKLVDLIMEKNPVPGLETKRDYVDALLDQLGGAVARGEDIVYLQKATKEKPEKLLQLLLNEERRLEAASEE
jgi:hypothetical protein